MASPLYLSLTLCAQPRIGQLTNNTPSADRPHLSQVHSSAAVSKCAAPKNGKVSKGEEAFVTTPLTNQSSVNARC